MNAKRARFIKEYLIDMNATEAAIRAGYSRRSAGQTSHRMMKIDEIRDAITQGREKLADRADMSAEWVLKQLRENHDLARESGELTQSTRAIELIGKQLGMFTDRIQHEGDVVISVNTGIAAGVGSRVKHGND